MSFPHEAPDFRDLLQIVAVERKLSRGVVEKDYWVTHTLWAIQGAGFDLWFKGGTSLSKGFGLIQRFSEDLDLKIEPGRVAQLPAVSNWKSQGTKATAERRSYFEKLPEVLLVPGAQLALDPGVTDKAWRGATVRVNYPGQYLTDLAGLRRRSERDPLPAVAVIQSYVPRRLQLQSGTPARVRSRIRQVEMHPLAVSLEEEVSERGRTCQHKRKLLILLGETRLQRCN